MLATTTKMGIAGNGAIIVLTEAVIEHVEYDRHGEAMLFLSTSGDPIRLTMDDPPKPAAYKADLRAAIGTRVFLDDRHVYIGRKIWAKRIGSKRIVLAEKCHG